MNNLQIIFKVFF